MFHCECRDEECGSDPVVPKTHQVEEPQVLVLVLGVILRENKEMVSVDTL